MNLRDKLREQPGDADEVTGSVPEAPAPKPGRAAKPAAKKAAAPGKSLLPALDVNRRFLVIAGAAAALTSILVVMYVGNSASGLADGGTKVEVYVPTVTLKPGVKLSEDNIETREIPKAYLPEGYFTAKTKDKLLQRMTIAPIVKGQPLLEAQTSQPDPKFGIAYLLKSGERAKTIAVNSAAGLAGLIRPGNEVDLIATIPDHGNDGRRIGTPVLQKARVIAVGDQLLGEVKPAATSGDEPGNAPKSQDGSGISSQGTITLAVPAPKIGLVTLLEDLGNLKIVLRAAGDDTIVATPFSDDMIMSLVSGKLPPPEAVKPKPRPVVHHEAPPVHHAPVVHHEPPHPHPPVHHEPPKPQPKPHPVVVKHVAPPHPATHGVQVIQFGGSH